MNKRSGLITTVVVVIVFAAGLFAGRQWGQHSSTTTSVATTTNVTTTTLASQPTSAIWPFASTPTRFATPELAAQTFVLDYLGFTNPVMEPFQQGDTRSGEVPVRSSLNGATTTVLVRQVTSDDSWWVIGAVSPNIALVTPAALEAISNPILLKGTSTAYEAVVNVQIRQDGSLAPLARTTFMGGSMGVMGPFSKTVTYTAPTSPAGAIVMYTLSAKDGSVLEASVLRVAFAK
ncbi:MAG: Gmad2 immunoglobulin-like domain-containing protein [Acidimicrobiales bacterium]